MYYIDDLLAEGWGSSQAGRRLELHLSAPFKRPGRTPDCPDTLREKH